MRTVMKRKTYKKYCTGIIIICNTMATPCNCVHTRQFKAIVEISFLISRGNRPFVTRARFESLWPDNEDTYSCIYRGDSTVPTAAGAPLMLLQLLVGTTPLALVLNYFCPSSSICVVCVVSEYNMFRWDGYDRGNNINGQRNLCRYRNFYFSAPPTIARFPGKIKYPTVTTNRVAYLLIKRKKIHR